MKTGAIPVCTNAIAEIDHKVYFALSQLNAICKADLGGVSVEYLYSLKDEKKNLNLFRDTYSYKNKVVFIPFRAENILIYDTVKKVFSVKAIPINKVADVYFLNSYILGECIYLFDTLTGKGFTYNLRQEVVDVLDSNIMLNKRIDSTKIFPMGMAKVADNLYAPTFDSGILAKIDITIGKIERIEIPTENSEILGISSDGGKLYILAKDETILKLEIWTNEREEMQTIVIDKAGFGDKPRIFHPPFVWEDRVYIIPYSNGYKSYVVEFENGRAKVKSILGEELQYAGIWFLKVIEKKLLFQSRCNDEWYSYDLINEKVLRHWKCKLEAPKLIEITNLNQMKEELNLSGLIQEKNGYLESFLNNICRL